MKPTKGRLHPDATLKDVTKWSNELGDAFLENGRDEQGYYVVFDSERVKP